MRPCRFPPATRRPSITDSFRAAPLALVFVAVLLLAGCTVQLEPSYDARIVNEIETLTLETETFFASIPDGIPAAGYAEREKAYIALAGRAAAIKVYAAARPAPSGRLAGFFRNLVSIPAPPGISAASGGERESGSPEGDRYENATAGYMEDYLRNLKKLADRDRETAGSVADLSQFDAAQSGFQEALEAYKKSYAEWVAGRGVKPADLGPAPTPPGARVSGNFVERRRLVLEDILHDALFYERDVLNRNR